MTCAECMDALLVADLRAGRALTDAGEAEPATIADIDLHTASCERCARAAQIVRAAEMDLASALVASSTRLTAESIAEFAYRRIRRERLINWTVGPAIALVFILGVALLVGKAGSELRAFFTPPPPVETQTFSLNCLSGEQAASLLRPYLPTPQNPMWQAERFDVRAAGGGIRAVTVRAPRSTLALVPELIARFERDPRAACRQ